MPHRSKIMLHHRHIALFSPQLFPLGFGPCKSRFDPLRKQTGFKFGNTG